MLHVVALSFEHRRGNQIDRVYPEFPDEPQVADWNQGLPFIAIPDKAHGACSSTIQFTLPHPKMRNCCVYGLAAFRSIDSSELADRDSYVRNQVQKSLCVISRVPLFGELEKLLKAKIYENFDCLVEKLEDIYESLKTACEKETVPFSGISYASLFSSLQMNVLVLVKAIMARHRILIFAENSELVSKMVCAIASLLPGFIYEEPTYPFRFLESNSYCFSPYVPLQFTETLNHAKSRSSLMGTCSELFMDQKIVDYDILVDCRKAKATLKGKPLEYLRLGANETEYMQKLLDYLTLNWEKEDSPDYIRARFRRYIDTVFVSFLRVRHIKEVKPFIWPYLDWAKPRLFGERFVSKLLRNRRIVKLIKENKREDFGTTDKKLVKVKIGFLENFPMQSFTTMKS